MRKLQCVVYPYSFILFLLVLPVLFRKNVNFLLKNEVSIYLGVRFEKNEYARTAMKETCLRARLTLIRTGYARLLT